MVYWGWRFLYGGHRSFWNANKYIRDENGRVNENGCDYGRDVRVRRPLSLLC
jgi:hypothetical protein